MKAIFLAVSLLLPLSFSVDRLSPLKSLWATVQSPQAIFPLGWPKKRGYFAKMVWTWISFISEEELLR